MEFIRIDDGRFIELAGLHGAYKREIGEAAPTDAELAALKTAINEGRICFFGCVCGGALVACCSVSTVFSTFNYGPAGVFEDFYILPEWRHRGVARRLAAFAYAESGVRSMTVGCADCDAAMYRAIGFGVPIGSMLAYSAAEAQK